MRLAHRLIAAANILAIGFVMGLVSGEARADVMAYVENKDGGRIELHDVRCPNNPDGLIARTWSPKVPDQFGCWTKEPGADTVTVYWLSGTSWTYDLKWFTFTTKAKPAKRNSF